MNEWVGSESGESIWFSAGDYRRFKAPHCSKVPDGIAVQRLFGHEIEIGASIVALCTRNRADHIRAWSVSRQLGCPKNLRDSLPTGEDSEHTCRAASDRLQHEEAISIWGHVVTVKCLAEAGKGEQHMRQIGFDPIAADPNPCGHQI